MPVRNDLTDGILVWVRSTFTDESSDSVLILDFASADKRQFHIVELDVGGNETNVETFISVPAALRRMADRIEKF
jgi:hypothetical protein